MTDVDRHYAEIDPEVERAGRVFVGTARLRPGSTDGPRVTSAYKLVFLHQGGATVQMDRQALRLEAQHVSLVTPGHHEVLRYDHDQESRQSWLVLQRPPLPQAHIEALNAAPFSLPVSVALEHLLNAGLALGKVLPTTQARRAPLVSLATTALVLYLEEARARGIMGTTAREHPVVAHARSYMQQRLREPLTLQDLAHAADVSPEHLVRLFRRQTGMTPFQHLWAERLRVGVHLLEHTGLPIKEVAVLSGFCSFPHFSRSIRAAMGVSPTEVRRRS